MILSNITVDELMITVVQKLQKTAMMLTETLQKLFGNRFSGFIDKK